MMEKLIIETNDLELIKKLANIVDKEFMNNSSFQGSFRTEKNPISDYLE